MRKASVYVKHRIISRPGLEYAALYRFHLSLRIAGSLLQTAPVQQVSNIGLISPEIAIQIHRFTASTS
jgi:hypothetical protein